MARQRLLIAIAVLGACGLACVTTSWWGGLSPEAQTRAIANLFAAWFCCGGPLAGGVAGWTLNMWRREGWRRTRSLTEDL